MLHGWADRDGYKFFARIESKCELVEGFLPAPQYADDPVTRCAIHAPLFNAHWHRGLVRQGWPVIKNAIVLIDQIDVEIREGKDKLRAIVDSGVSRMRPVSMAAITTILGLAPLLGDAFFVAMAVTIMVGLGFATVLTLIVVPVLYAIFFKVPFSEEVLAKK